VRKNLQVTNPRYRLFSTSALLSTGFLSLMLAAPLSAQQTPENSVDEVPVYLADARAALERINVVGSRVRQREIPGAATYLGAEELEVFEHSDINRILRQVPGINIQEEDGFGLRPNIGIRGTGIERSERITLMEDGVLIAPAPYAAPAAYYFPSAARLSAVEVRKGSSAIKFGPRTIGGAINLISTPIGDEPGGFLTARGGSHGQLETHLAATGEAGQLSFMVEGLHMQASGFKELRNGGDTGFRIDDIVGKFRLTSSDSAAYEQQFEIKLGYTDQNSQETYLGLTDADFAVNPLQRYAASQLDEFNSLHKQIQATHYIELSSAVDVTTVAYYNSFKRDWFKLDDLDFADGRGRIRPSEVFGDPTNPLNIAALAILRGDADSGADALQLRHNAREYYSAGVQTIVGYEFDTGAAAHSMELSIRYHKDEEDRLQNRENFAMVSGQMVRTSVDAPGSQANRVAGAEAIAAFLQDEIVLDNWRIIPGLRFEHINLIRSDFSKSDPERALGPAARRENTVNVFIPGLGIAYDISATTQLLAGLHKGFSPPGPSASNASSEQSLNLEAGVRYMDDGAKLEVIGFYNDYSNILGTCSNATGCEAGDIGDQFNGGDVSVTGVEFSASYTIPLSGQIWLPLSLVYTYTNAEFETSFSNGFWGDVTKGDKLPYIPTHQANLNIGIENTDWAVQAAVNYVAETRAVAGQGTIPRAQSIDARWVIDVSASYRVLEQLRLFATADNLFDNSYIVARRPYGARPGKPRSIFIGLTWDF
jgi:Fe(3+) dicitrate transport protein